MPLNGHPKSQALAVWFRRIGFLTLSLLAFTANPRAEEAANTIHFELLGNGILYSINYDRLINHNFSARVGYMYLSAEATSSDPNDPTKVTFSMSLIPVTASYLMGPGNHRLELGGGPVIAFVSADINDGVQGISGSGLASIVGIIGYRYQPMDGGFNFRAALTPHYVPNGDTHFLPWGGISLGYTF